MPSLQKRLGKTIRQLRKQAGYSQEGFADAVGVHRTYMGSVERGEVNIALENLQRIAAALGLSAAALLGAAERPSEPSAD